MRRLIWIELRKPIDKFHMYLTINICPLRTKTSDMERSNHISSRSGCEGSIKTEGQNIEQHPTL